MFFWQQHPRLCWCESWVSIWVLLLLLKKEGSPKPPSKNQAHNYYSTRGLMVGDSYNWLWNNPLTREVARCPKVVGDLLRSGYGKVIRDRTRVTVLSRNFSSSGDFLFLFRHESIIVETFIIIFNPDTYRGKLLMYFVSLLQFSVAF